MDHPNNDKLKMRYIAIAAAVCAVFFIVLAFGNLGRQWTSAKNGGTGSSSNAGSAAGSTLSGTEASAGTGSNGSGTESAGASGTSSDAAAQSGNSSTSTSSSGGTSSGNADITITATGDVTLGKDDSMDYDVSMNAYYDGNGPEYFFQNMRETLSSDDLTVINFEGTLTTSEDRADKTYAFRADPSWAEILTDGSIEAADIANNHTADYGSEGTTDTETALANAGIEYFGNDRTVVTEVKGIKVGLTGTIEVYDGTGCRDDMVSRIEELKNKGAQLVICCMHWGDEGSYQPSDAQIELAHAAVDAGADLVIGNHPHRLQLVDQYNGKYIFYSLGNFCFGGNSAPADMDSAVIQQTFHFENGTLASADDIHIVPISISSADGYNNYQPTPFETDSEGYSRVLTKLRGEYSNDTGTTNEEYSNLNGS